jgi:murein DD-endopeptidase MepM/ murein hydrolase activator NlpD
MDSFRELRRNRQLTLLDVARLSGIPARLLAEAECGLRTLSRDEAGRLAFIFGIDEEQLPARPIIEAPFPFVSAQVLVAATLASALLTSTLRIENLPRFSFAGSGGNSIAPPPAIERVITRRAVGLPRPEPQPAPRPTTSLVAAAGADADLEELPVSPLMLPLELTDTDPLPDEQYFAPIEPAPPPPAATAQPELAARPFVESELHGRSARKTPPPPVDRSTHEHQIVVPPGSFAMSEAGPVGCPVLPLRGRVVMTQGYGVGSHAPADVWGAVDLAIDANGDGWAESGSSFGVPIVATHDGVAYTSQDSWPGGNYVTVIDHGSGWRTGYAHMERILVTSGQHVTAGTIIGLMGDTGMTTGPHLDYQVWFHGRNLDPTGLVGACGG